MPKITNFTKKCISLIPQKHKFMQKIEISGKLEKQLTGIRKLGTRKRQILHSKRNPNPIYRGYPKLVPKCRFGGQKLACQGRFRFPGGLIPRGGQKVTTLTI